MKKIIECVPNFSEGKNPEVIAALETAVSSVRGVHLLRSEMDIDHHRAVLTFIGSPDPVCDAVFRACARAAELIDLRIHQGVHPRIGATDVIPLVPISGISEEECIDLARGLGARIAEKLQIPVYLYGAAATQPDRENLANCRIGGFEGLRDTIGTDPARKPDFGEARIHPSAGAVAVGVRRLLIAYNVNLDTRDVRIAKRIAGTTRERDGGLKSVKALGLTLDDLDMTQVSMNLTNYNDTSMTAAYDRVKYEAEKEGCQVVESELIGLVNLESILEAASKYLRLEDLDRSRILDLRVVEALAHDDSIDAFLDAVADAATTPAAGSVVALSAASSIGLASMACGVTLKDRTRLAAHEEFTRALVKAEEIRNRATSLIEGDADAFRSVIRAMRIPKSDHRRNDRLDSAWQQATTIPLRIVECCTDILPVLHLCAEKGSEAIVPEIGVATLQIDAAGRSGAMIVEENIKHIQDESYRVKCRTDLGSLTSQSGGWIKQIQAVLYQRKTRDPG